MKKKTIYLFIAVLVGYIFNQLHIPAGWLLGSLFTGMGYGILINKLSFGRSSFKIVLTFVGANISLLLTTSTLKLIPHLIIPLVMTIFITIVASFFFGLLLFKKAKDVDKITAFFCCIPGGASEIIGISGQYGADDRLVAAFHTLRITFFTISIPLIVGYLNPISEKTMITQENVNFNSITIIFFLTVILLAFLLDYFLKFPGGILIFSILIGFILTEFIFEIEQVPKFIGGIGQALIGAFVGIRFDKDVLKKIWKLGPITLIIILLFFLLTLLIAIIFELLTDVSFSTSLISTVPAGAAEMSVTAVALNINPTIVATLHIIRLILLFLSLPLLLKLVNFINKK